MKTQGIDITDIMIKKKQNIWKNSKKLQEYARNHYR